MRLKICSPHVAALGILERGGAQVDPIGGGEIADRHRLVLLQRHQNDFPVLGRFPAREGHVLDLVALAHDGLERLLLRREAIPGFGHDQGSGERAQFLHESLLDSVLSATVVLDSSYPGRSASSEALCPAMTAAWSV